MRNATCTFPKDVLVVGRSRLAVLRLLLEKLIFQVPNITNTICGTLLLVDV
nr:unnamed protein product [Callosobruchus analis]